MTIAQHILGTMLTLPLGSPCDFSADDWDNSAQKAIHAALMVTGPCPDPVVLRHELGRQGYEAWEYQLELDTCWCGGVYTQRDFDGLILRLKAEQSAREAKRTALDIVERLENGLTAEQAYPMVESLLRSCAPRTDDDPEHVGDHLEDLFLGSDKPAVPLGLGALDRLGCYPGSLTVFAARPGGGKTAMLGQIAVAAAQVDWRVLFVSLEMPAKQIRQRLLANLCSIPIQRIVHPTGTELIANLEPLKALPILIRDTVRADFTLTQLVTHVRRFAGAPRSLVLVDYLQLVRPGHKIERRYEQIGHVCRELKAAALAHDLPVIAAAQLGRSAEQRGEKSAPQLSDLRESGDIEATADNVVLMEQKENSCVLAVRKQRMGPKFKAECRFIPETCQFEDLPPIS